MISFSVPEIQELFEAVIDASFAYRIPEHSPIPRKFEPMYVQILFQSHHIKIPWRTCKCSEPDAQSG